MSDLTRSITACPCGKPHSFKSGFEHILCAFCKNTELVQKCRSKHCVAGNSRSGIAFILNFSCGVNALFDICRAF